MAKPAPLDPVQRPGPGTDPAKLGQILEGARKVFLELGFDGASMGDIARAAGVSKGTLYVYFASKEALFSALITDESHRSKWDAVLDPADPDIGGALKRYGRTFIFHISRPGNIDSVRTVMAIAERFPRVGEDFYRNGPKRGFDYVSGYLAAQAAAGRLRIADVASAAQQLRGLMTAGILNEQLFGVRAVPDEDEIGRVVDEAVTTFLARYAARPENS